MSFENSTDTHPYGDDHPYDTAIEITYGMIFIFCFTLGCLGNTIATHFFAPQYKSHCGMIYLFITINDLLISLLALPMALTYLSTNRAALVFSNGFLCDVYGVIWNITSRLSIYLVAVLSIARTYTLYYPFRRVNKTRLLTCNILYTALLILQALVPYTAATRYVFSKDFVQCFVLLGELFPYRSTAYILMYVILIQLEVTIPILPIILSCGMSACLMRREPPHRHNHVVAGQRRAATTTILLFTLLYIFLNIPAVLFEVLSAVESFYRPGSDFFWWDQPGRYFRNLVYVVSVVVNATANPCLYLLRMNSFRVSTQSNIHRLTTFMTVSLSERARSTTESNSQV